jgi:hypothetical protein
VISCHHLEEEPVPATDITSAAQPGNWPDRQPGAPAGDHEPGPAADVARPRSANFGLRTAVLAGLVAVTGVAAAPATAAAAAAASAAAPATATAGSLLGPVNSTCCGPRN